jgi:hypothetical protein
MTKLSFMGLAALLLVAPVGCGDSESNGDGGVADGGGLLGDSAAAVTNTHLLTSGKYKVTGIAPDPTDPAMAAMVHDECKITPEVLKGDEKPEDWVPVDVSATEFVKVGNPKGDQSMPATLKASLGEGQLIRTGTTSTLTRMNHVKVPGTPCEYDNEVNSILTLDGDNTFGLGVTEKQTNRAAGCVEPVGVPANCTSVWTWRLVKAQ